MADVMFPQPKVDPRGPTRTEVEEWKAYIAEHTGEQVSDTIAALIGMSFRNPSFAPPVMLPGIIEVAEDEQRAMPKLAARLTRNIDMPRD